jgi:hypothetical protein
MKEGRERKKDDEKTINTKKKNHTHNKNKTNHTTQKKTKKTQRNRMQLTCVGVSVQS